MLILKIKAQSKIAKGDKGKSQLLYWVRRSNSFVALLTNLKDICHKYINPNKMSTNKVQEKILIFKQGAQLLPGHKAHVSDPQPLFLPAPQPSQETWQGRPSSSGLGFCVTATRGITLTWA